TPTALRTGCIPCPKATGRGRRRPETSVPARDPYRCRDNPVRPAMRRTVLFPAAILCFLPLAAFARGELLVGNKSDDTVWRLSLEDGRRLAEIASAPGPHEIAVSPDGRTAIVTGYGHREPGNALTVVALGDGS